MAGVTEQPPPLAKAIKLEDQTLGGISQTWAVNWGRGNPCKRMAAPGDRQSFSFNFLSFCASGLLPSVS
jgi:hypothetical protein